MLRSKPTRKCPSSENSIIYSSQVVLKYSGADSARHLDVHSCVHGSDLKKAWGTLRMIVIKVAFFNVRINRYAMKMCVLAIQGTLDACKGFSGGALFL